MPGVTLSTKLLLSAIGAVALIGAGFASAEIYEHTAKWGLSHKLEAARADATKGWAQVEGWKTNRQGWVDYAGRLEKDRDRANDAAGDQVTSCSASAATTTHQAFDTGYAAGKRIGLKSCGAPHDQPTVPLPPGCGAAPCGVLDHPGADPFFGGDRAFSPASAVPAHR